jgi:amidohydrolase
LEQLKEKIKKLSNENLQEVITIRRHIHQNPELSFQEFKTSEFICSKLDEYAIPYTSGIVKTGIVAEIRGTKPDTKTVALRADLDALPIQENNDVSYKSQNPGIMHACGHDVHSACLLGAAKILNEIKGEFSGTVKLIFQPGEEKLPGGASLMIQEGVLDEPRPQAIIAQHVYPSMEAGKVGFRPGMYMASTDEIYITVKGKGGHAAMPAAYNNPIFIASKILLELQAKFMDETTREIPDIPTVLAFGKFIANGATNVIPDEVKIEGTFRTMDENWRKEAHLKMITMAERIAEEMGGTCIFDVMHGYPYLKNHPELTDKAKSAAEEYLGRENVEILPMRMTAEDFSFYSQLVPACFYRIGTANKEKGITSGVHTSTFDIDEKAIEIGMGLMAWLAINELKN